jgi:uncharacterized membrane protein
MLLVLGAALAALNAVVFMAVPGAGAPEFKERFLATPLAGWIHTMGGALAVLIGPFQLWPGSRARWRRTHIWLGRCYVLAVAASGLAGLFFAQTSVGGTVGRVGFSSLAVLWLSSVGLAYAAIRRGALDSHRRWMLRNYALTFAVVTLRVQLPLLLLGGLSLSSAIAIVAWTCWIPNGLAVEAWLTRAARERSGIVS